MMHVSGTDDLFLFQEIMYCYGDTMSTVKVISTVFSYLDRKPACKEEGALAPEKLKGGIVFQNVTFRYPSAPPDQPALKVTVTTSCSVIDCRRT